MQELDDVVCILQNPKSVYLISVANFNTLVKLVIESNCTTVELSQYRDNNTSF